MSMWNLSACFSLVKFLCGAGCCEHILVAEVAGNEIPQWGIGALANLRLASFPETNCQKPLKIGRAPKRKLQVVFQPSIFRCFFAVSQRVSFPQTKPASLLAWTFQRLEDENFNFGSVRQLGDAIFVSQFVDEVSIRLSQHLLVKLLTCITLGDVAGKGRAYGESRVAY